jgi:hypothetical protein
MELKARASYISCDHGDAFDSSDLCDTSGFNLVSSGYFNYCVLDDRGNSGLPAYLWKASHRSLCVKATRQLTKGIGFNVIRRALTTPFAGPSTNVQPKAPVPEKFRILVESIRHYHDGATRTALGADLL